MYVHLLDSEVPRDWRKAHHVVVLKKFYSVKFFLVLSWEGHDVISHEKVHFKL